jgi:hypothetical protein
MFGRGSLAILTLVSVLAAGCGTGTHTSVGKVLTDRTGVCPLRNLDHLDESKLAAPCTVGRRENAVGGMLKRPKTSWGVAYAFNCGKRPAQFRWQLGSPGGDVGVPNTGIWTTARRGRGYQMMTAHRLAALQGMPGMWASVLDIEITSDCTWHVRSVSGDTGAVRAAIPAVPTYRDPENAA